jgi:hypothetical protein
MTICAGGIPAQILHPIVVGHVVEVAAFRTGWPWPNECFKDKVVYKSFLPLAVAAQAHLRVRMTRVTHVWTEDLGGRTLE